MYSDYNYYNTYGNYDAATTTAVTSTLLAIYIIYMVVVLAIAVVQVIAMWKMFKKAGKEGWEAIIPFYNYWVLFEISGYPGYYSLFFLIPCFGPFIVFVFGILASISLSKKFNKSSGFAVLLILVPIVGYCILGFGDDEYDASLGEQKNTADNVTEVKVETKTTEKAATGDKFCGNCGTKVAKNAKHCSNCGKEL